MTRRERMLRIIESFGYERVDRAVLFMQAGRGRHAALRYEIFTDAAIDEIARRLVDDRRLNQRYARENRARRAS